MSSFTEYMKLSPAKQKRMLRLVDHLIRLNKAWDRDTLSYRVFLNTLKKDFPEQSVDLIKLHKLD